MYHRTVILILLITLSIALSTPLNQTTAVSCTVGVGGDYPNVQTAIADSCYQIRFVSNAIDLLVEVNPIPPRPYPLILETIDINLAGYTWIIHEFRPPIGIPPEYTLSIRNGAVSSIALIRTAMLFMDNVSINPWTINFMIELYTIQLTPLAFSPYRLNFTNVSITDTPAMFPSRIHIRTTWVRTPPTTPPATEIILDRVKTSNLLAEKTIYIDISTTSTATISIQDSIFTTPTPIIWDKTLNISVRTYTYLQINIYNTTISTGNIQSQTPIHIYSYTPSSTTLRIKQSKIEVNGASPEPYSVMMRGEYSRIRLEIDNTTLKGQHSIDIQSNSYTAYIELNQLYTPPYQGMKQDKAVYITGTPATRETVSILVRDTPIYTDTLEIPTNYVYIDSIDNAYIQYLNVDIYDTRLVRIEPDRNDTKTLTLDIDDSILGNVELIREDTIYTAQQYTYGNITIDIYNTSIDRATLTLVSNTGNVDKSRIEIVIRESYIQLFTTSPAQYNYPASDNKLYIRDSIIHQSTFSYGAGIYTDVDIIDSNITYSVLSIDTGYTPYPEAGEIYIRNSILNDTMLILQQSIYTTPAEINISMENSYLSGEPSYGAVNTVLLVDNDVYMNASYSYIHGFTVDDLDGISEDVDIFLIESIVDEHAIQLNPNDNLMINFTWTIEVELLSTLTGEPVPNQKVDVSYGSTSTVIYTDSNGLARYRFSYIYGFSNPPPSTLSTITLSTDVESFNIYTDYSSLRIVWLHTWLPHGQGYTMPNWYLRIQLYTSGVYISGYGASRILGYITFTLDDNELRIYASHGKGHPMMKQNMVRIYSFRVLSISASQGYSYMMITIYIPSSYYNVLGIAGITQMYIYDDVVWIPLLDLRGYKT